MLPESSGRGLVRVNEGIESRGIGKKRITSCNERYRGSKNALTRKGADLPNWCFIVCSEAECNSSITPIKCEGLTETQPKHPWADFDGNKVEEHVNRLQTRITKL